MQRGKGSTALKLSERTPESRSYTYSMKIKVAVKGHANYRSTKKNPKD